jgi:serine protease Do
VKNSKKPFFPIMEDTAPNLKRRSNMAQKRKKRFLPGLIPIIVFSVVLLFAQECNSNPESYSASTSKSTAQPQPQNTAQKPDQTFITELSRAFEAASGVVSPSVVSIYAEEVVVTQSQSGLPDDALKNFFGEDFFKRFFGPSQPQTQTVRSLGSGVIVNSDGYILTNNHVVAKAQKLSVVLNDKRTYKATVIGTDPPTDVAVVKIDAQNLPVASLGNSDMVRVGQWVLAVGNPFQLTSTVTAGIISARGRSSVGLADYGDFIQTDASINPGNSGGALADLDGNVIAINTAILSQSGGNIGIGFAIPINMARQVMDQLIEKGKVVRGYLSLYPQDIDQDLARALDLSSTEGAIVASVPPGGPADKAGIKAGDVIISFDGKKITDSTQLRNLVAQTAPGTRVKIGLLRDGKEMEVNAVLAERPPSQESTEGQQEQPGQSSHQNLGLQIQTLTPSIAQQLGYTGESGAVVTQVTPGSVAEDAGLRAGDLVKEVNHTSIRSASDFSKIIRGMKSGDVAALLVQRGQGSFFTTITIP